MGVVRRVEGEHPLAARKGVAAQPLGLAAGFGVGDQQSTPTYRRKQHSFVPVVEESLQRSGPLAQRDQRRFGLTGRRGRHHYSPPLEFLQPGLQCPRLSLNRTNLRDRLAAERHRDRPSLADVTEDFRKPRLRFVRRIHKAHATRIVPDQSHQCNQRKTGTDPNLQHARKRAVVHLVRVAESHGSCYLRPVSDRSRIEWTDATWNPIRGCSKVSPGCRHCYAERFAERFRGVPGHPFERGFDLRIVPEKLNQPLSWRRPRRVFVNSMSDLFRDPNRLGRRHRAPVPRTGGSVLLQAMGRRPQTRDRPHAQRPHVQRVSRWHANQGGEHSSSGPEPNFLCRFSLALRRSLTFRYVS